MYCLWREKCSFTKRTNRKREAKSQHIAVQGLLSCLQHLVLYLSRVKRIYLSQYLKLYFSIPTFNHTWGKTECVAILCWRIHKSVPIVIPSPSIFVSALSFHSPTHMVFWEIHGPRTTEWSVVQISHAFRYDPHTKLHFNIDWTGVVCVLHDPQRNCSDDTAIAIFRDQELAHLL